MTRCKKFPGMGVGVWGLGGQIDILGIWDKHSNSFTVAQRTSRFSRMFFFSYSTIQEKDKK